MKTIYLSLFFICLNSFISFSQSIDSVTEKELDSISNTNTDENFLFMMEGDTTAVKAFELDEVLILKKLKFETSLAYKKYLILKRKTRKVYPYAKMAADTLSNLVADLNDLKKKRHRKKHIRKMQRFLQKKFTPELKKMSRTEGQILVKLIHRQTGITMYNLIKEYRNGVKAFFYERTASLFDISLKKEFNPETVYEDYLIEDILERSFQDDVLVRQKSPLNYNLLELSSKWKKPKPKLTPIH